ncbi:hypothetical protein CONCODRAFT_167378, partial [Conidiobolus coronatus NRRL 28638]
KKIFNEILVYSYNLSLLDNHFESNRYSYNDVPERDLDSISNFKSTNIDPFMTELADVVNYLAEYFKSITFFNLDRLGYYVIPITLSFNRLVNLDINTCCLYIKDFNRLMGKLDKLEQLKLIELYLIKSPDDGFNESEIKVPSTLKRLYLGHTYICSTNLPNTPYKFLVKYSGNIDKREFHLSPKHLKNLEKFELITVINNNNFISSLLNLTPKLTKITLPIQNYSMQVMEVLSENSVINQLNLKFNFQGELFPLDTKLPVLNSLRALTLLLLIIPDQYLQIYQLIDALPNLTKLELEFEYYESEFVAKLLSKLTKLKVLELKISKYTNYSLDLTILTGIVRLIFYNYSNSKIIYKLPDASDKLKTIILPLYGKNKQRKVEIVNELDNANANWVISLQGSMIYCRISNIKQ